jgi:hypothetical protein
MNRKCKDCETISDEKNMTKIGLNNYVCKECIGVPIQEKEVKIKKPLAHFTCNKCKKIKHIDEFWINKFGKPYRSCKSCSGDGAEPVDGKITCTKCWNKRTTEFFMKNKGGEKYYHWCILCLIKNK